MLQVALLALTLALAVAPAWAGAREAEAEALQAEETIGAQAMERVRGWAVTVPEAMPVSVLA